MIIAKNLSPNSFAANDNHYFSGSNHFTQTNKVGTLRNFTYMASCNMDILYGYGGRDLEHAFTLGGVLTSVSQYTALGERVLKWVKSVQTTHYHYDENHHLIAEGNGNSGSIQKEYIWLSDMPLATTDSSGNVYYVHTDQLGTPQKITNSTPAIVWDRIVQPFGEYYSITGTLTYSLGFPGQYYDSEQFLYYNNARTMEPSIGRYIETDPIGWAGTTMSVRNLYGYAGQNPIRFSDPSGLDFSNLRCAWENLWQHNISQNNATDNSSNNPSSDLPQGSSRPDIFNEDAASDTPTPEEIADKTPEEIDDMMQGMGWKGEPSASGEGTRYPNPGIKGEQVRVQPGDPNNSNL